MCLSCSTFLCQHGFFPFLKLLKIEIALKIHVGQIQIWNLEDVLHYYVSILLNTYLVSCHKMFLITWVAEYLRTGRHMCMTITVLYVWY